MLLYIHMYVYTFICAHIHKTTLNRGERGKVKKQFHKERQDSGPIAPLRVS